MNQDLSGTGATAVATGSSPHLDLEALARIALECLKQDMADDGPGGRVVGISKKRGRMWINMPAFLERIRNHKDSAGRLWPLQDGFLRDALISAHGQTARMGSKTADPAKTSRAVKAFHAEVRAMLHGLQMPASELMEPAEDLLNRLSEYVGARPAREGRSRVSPFHFVESVSGRDTMIGKLFLVNEVFLQPIRPGHPVGWQQSTLPRKKL
jgi:hypothetical protein